MTLESHCTGLRVGESLRDRRRRGGKKEDGREEGKGDGRRKGVREEGKGGWKKERE